ncbi:PREDICTED: synaptotagmin-5-like isoform X2 [Ipomoea nil]|uniref:synaptotagmin-5-like isoform X2 n=1 Tax=Ipomoea nil TaxID=35883 RepID=UPI000900E65B|nr:PREDICTED: synaptotagmin-5-like isoform X2 [Ipomoea nil]
MGKRRKSFSVSEAMESLNNLMAEKPLLPVLVLLFLMVWGIEKWFFNLSNWVPLAFAVWAAFQYTRYQRHILTEDLNKKWMQTLLQNSQATPLEQCEWLNKLLLEIWQNYIGKRMSLRFSYMIERRLKHRKPRIIEKIELQEFSLGSRPPILGIHGIRWSTSGDQRILHMGFDWDTDDISVLLLAKLGKPLMGTARIVINSLHIKGDLQFIPVLDGKAILYSFISTPEVRIGIAFGSGGSQFLPATEVPGVSAWLVKVVTDLLVKRMVEPRRNCLALPAVNLEKKAVGGVLSVTVISASQISRGISRKQQSPVADDCTDDLLDYIDLRTFVEVELEELSRKTDVRPGSCPRWDSKFNMTLHDDTGILRFNLYECTPGSVKCDYLTSCEIKVKYVADDSTIFWAADGESAITRQAEFCGKEIEMVVPFEGVNSGELSIKLALKEWQFSDGSHTTRIPQLGSLQSINGSSNFLSNTGRKIYVTVIEGKNLPSKDRHGKSGSGTYAKLQYGKGLKRTRTAPHTSDPEWNQKFEFDEIGGGEYLKIRCFIEERFSDENIGCARVNLEGLVEGSPKDVWIPLEKVNSGELRLHIEAMRVDDYDGSKDPRNGWIELTLIEGKDLIAADIRGTSDPYVRVQYGNLKRKTKVMYKTLNPQWHQTLEFPDDGSPLTLHVKDHNALLPESSIGDCVVEYQRFPRNQMFDKWIPLQGVRRGEIHIQITRKAPDTEKKPSLDAVSSVAKARHGISQQMKQMMIKLQSLVDDNDQEGLSTSLHELESLHETQEDFMLQLETEQGLLLNKINELGQEIFNSSSSPNNLGRKSTFP